MIYIEIITTRDFSRKKPHVGVGVETGKKFTVSFLDGTYYVITCMVSIVVSQPVAYLGGLGNAPPLFSKNFVFFTIDKIRKTRFGPFVWALVASKHLLPFMES